MKKNFLLLSILIVYSLASFAQGSALTRKLVNGKFGWGYPSLTKKDGMGYPLVETLAIPAIYDNTSPVTFADEYENLVAVELNGKWGFIDATGATKLPFKYDEAAFFYEGLAPVKLNGKCGFIDKTGKIVLPLKYDDATSFKDGLAYVELGGKVGFINKKGEVVVPIKYDISSEATYRKCSHCGGVIYNFENGKCPVVLNGKCGSVDMKGNFTACADLPEVIKDSITYSGRLNTNKDLWNGNAGVHILCSCEPKTDVMSVTVNGKTDYANLYADNKIMNVAIDPKWKPGQVVNIKIVYKKGSTFKFSGKQGVDFTNGEILVAETPDPRAANALDSTIFSGTINARMMAIIQSSDGAQDIKKVTVNDMDITAKLIHGQRQIINFGVYKFKKGQDVTIKVVHLKGTTVKMLDPKGLD